VTRREYNREYMRRWRADPRNWKRDRAQRQLQYQAKKLREAQQPAEPVCFNCGRQRPPVRVERLDVYRWLPALVPWCGEC
jgi:hypothetical protein